MPLDALTPLWFFLILVFLIVIHELGHFLVSKAFGIQVEEFGIFFPPRLVRLFKWGETEVTLNALPLGGFVRPKGENDPTVAGGLAAAPAWQRICVMLAGPLMNLLVAVVLYSILAMNPGLPDPTKSNIVLVSSIVPGLPADSSGLQVNDQLVSIAGTKIESSVTAQQVISENKGKALDFEIRRSDALLHLTITPRVDTSDGRGAIGILMGQPMDKASLLEAPAVGFKLTTEYSIGLLTFLGRLVTGQLSGSDGQLLGFIGMYNNFAEVRNLEVQKVIPSGVGVMDFIVKVTISLGLLNLLPIPALDGGRILLSFIELITRRRLPTDLENKIIVITFLALIGLMILVNGREIYYQIFPVATATPSVIPTP